MTGLRSLRSLTDLSVHQELPGADLTDALPVDAPLESLFLGVHSIKSTGLRGLSRWASLRTLSFGSLATELTEDDWCEVAELPRLTRIDLNGRVLTHSVDPMPVLPASRFFRSA